MKVTHKGLVLIILVALAASLFGLAAMLMEISATEAFFGGMGRNYVFNVNFGVLMQPFQLFTGTLPPGADMPVIAAFGIEISFYAALIGFDMLHNSLKASGQLWAKIFKFYLGLCVIVDFFTNLIYSGSAGNVLSAVGMTVPQQAGQFAGRLLLATFVTGFVAFLPMVGVYMFEHAYHIHKSTGMPGMRPVPVPAPGGK